MNDLQKTSDKIWFLYWSGTGRGGGRVDCGGR